VLATRRGSRLLGPTLLTRPAPRHTSRQPDGAQTSALPPSKQRNQRKRTTSFMGLVEIAPQRDDGDDAPRPCCSRKLMPLAAVTQLALAAAALLQPQQPQQPPPRPLEPKVTFSLDADQPLADEADAEWRALARKAAALQQLDCTDGLLGATRRMVDEAERGDSLAMAALGVMCEPTFPAPKCASTTRSHSHECRCGACARRLTRAAVRTETQLNLGASLALCRGAEWPGGRAGNDGLPARVRCAA
jgi:hypothetical protein